MYSIRKKGVYKIKEKKIKELTKNSFCVLVNA